MTEQVQKHHTASVDKQTVLKYDSRHLYRKESLQEAGSGSEH